MGEERREDEGERRIRGEIWRGGDKKWGGKLVRDGEEIGRGRREKGTSADEFFGKDEEIRER